MGIFFVPLYICFPYKFLWQYSSLCYIGGITKNFVKLIQIF